MVQEQSEQYALTIVALEEKLLGLMDRCKIMQTEKVDLTEKLRVKTTTCEEETKCMQLLLAIAFMLEKRPTTQREN